MATSSTRPASIEKLVRRFQRSSDPRRRYEQLLWYAKRLEGFPEADKRPENKVAGCVSQVFINAKLTPEGTVQFQGESDAQITKGLVALLIEGRNGLSPQAVCDLTPDFIQETQLDVSLTPSRANGFYNIFKTMQQKAAALVLEAGA